MDLGEEDECGYYGAVDEDGRREVCVSARKGGQVNELPHFAFMKVWRP